MLPGTAAVLFVVYALWQLVWMVQTFFGYGTAYRLTRDRGNNGVALFGWMIVMSLAAAVPGNTRP